MIDPSEALQRAIVAVLEDIDFGALKVAIYDEPNPDAVYPYVCIGGMEVKSDYAEGYDGTECTAHLHICDNSIGTVIAKKIGKLVIAVLDAEIAIAGFKVIIHETMAASYLDDQQTFVRGLISQRYEISPND